MKRGFGFFMALVLLVVPTWLAAGAEVIVIPSGGGAQQEFEELTVDGAIRVSKEYIIDQPATSWYSDEAIAAGQYRLYLESKEDNAPIHYWYFPVDTHTPIHFSVIFTNMSTEKTNLLRRVSCQIVFDDRYVFDTTPMQVNPDQTNEKGETGTRSTDAVALEPLVGTTLSFLANVPLFVRDSEASLVAYLTIDEQSTYVVNLRDMIVTH